MPSPHPQKRFNYQPTLKQLRYLRQLAEATGQTFTPPRNKKQASAQIRRLLKATQETPVERDVERDRLDHEVDLPADATRIRDDETTGYGAHAHWAHSSDEEDRS
jgi:hypothetical protein